MLDKMTTFLCIIDEVNKLIGNEHEPRELPDDFNPGDSYGSNYDDCYYGGVNQGRAELAQEIREIFKKYVAS